MDEPQPRLSLWEVMKMLRTIPWDPAITEVRLMCSFDTTTEDIAGLLGAFRDLQVSESSPTLEPESRPG